MVIEVFNSVDKIYDLLKKASELILARFNHANLQISFKSEHSPVSDADIASNGVITEGLAFLFPDIPIISEENSNESNVKAVKSKSFWLLDPLDGTKEFIKGNSSFSINLALIKDNAPVLGFLYFPVQSICYYGFGNRVFKRYRGVLTVIKQSNHNQIRSFIMSNRADLEKVKKIRQILAPEAVFKNLSSAQKFGALIEGEADVLPCCNDVYEWDVAAGHAIMNAIGGEVMAFDGSGVSYGRSEREFVSNHFIAVRNSNMLNEIKKKSIVDLCF